MKKAMTKILTVSIIISIISLVIFHGCPIVLSQISDEQTKAFQTIQQITDSHPNDLPFVLQNDDSIRMNYTKANLFLTTFRLSAELQETYNFYKELLNSYPQYFARSIVYDKTDESNMEWIRERIYQTFINLEPLTADRKYEISMATKLTGRYLDIWNNFSVFLLDNANLDSLQKDFIYYLLSSVPTELHNLRSISIIDFFGKTPPEFSTWGPLWNPCIGSAINIFGTSIGLCIGNDFPDDVPQKCSCLFCGALVHELNHIVDADNVLSQNLKNREEDLIKRAGSDHMNYLRSMLPDGFFASAPQEFFASISNEWFSDSELTLKLALLRFDKGYKEPLNQFMFFAEVYSRGGNLTLFYNIDTQGDILRREIPVLRDENGRIVAIIDNDIIYRFTLDKGGYVISYNITKISPLQISVQVKPTSGNAPLTISFVISGSGGAPFYSYYWNFGDGLGSNVVSSNLSYTLHHTYTSVGDHIWALIVKDNSGLSANASGIITVEKVETSLSISFPSSCYVGNNITISGYISPSYSGASIEIQISGVENMTSYATTQNGQFSLSYTPLTLGKYIVQALFSGDAEHSESQSSIISFNVTKMPTTLTLSVSPSEVSIDITHSATTVTISGRIEPAIATTITINLYPSGGGIGTVVPFAQEVSTSNNGEFSATFTPTTTGTFTIDATFSGNDQYESSTASTSFTVVPNYTSVIVLFAVAICAIIVVLYIYKIKRKPAVPPPQ